MGGTWRNQKNGKKKLCRKYQNSPKAIAGCSPIERFPNTITTLDDFHHAKLIVSKIISSTTNRSINTHAKARRSIWCTQILLCVFFSSVTQEPNHQQESEIELNYSIHPNQSVAHIFSCPAAAQCSNLNSTKKKTEQNGLAEKWKRRINSNKIAHNKRESEWERNRKKKSRSREIIYIIGIPTMLILAWFLHTILCLSPSLQLSFQYCSNILTHTHTLGTNKFAMYQT